MNRSSEALLTNVLGPDGVAEMPGGRIVAVKGPEFIQDYITSYIMPKRFDTAQLALSAMLQEGGDACDDYDTLVAEAYDIADRFMLAERPTLDGVIDRYWDRYMTREKKTDDVMKSLVEESKDFSL